MSDQISRKQRDKEIAWVKRQAEEARNNVAAGIDDYATATSFELQAAIDVGDEMARTELTRRRNYHFPNRR